MADITEMTPDPTQDARNELPEGRVLAPLGSVCAINPRHERGVVADDTSVPFVPMAALDHQSAPQTLKPAARRPWACASSPSLSG